jgi:hypothetical protein
VRFRCATHSAGDHRVMPGRRLQASAGSVAHNARRRCSADWRSLMTAFS